MLFIILLMGNQYKSQKQHLLNVPITGGTVQQSKFARCAFPWNISNFLNIFPKPHLHAAIKHWLINLLFVKTIKYWGLIFPCTLSGVTLSFIPSHMQVLINKVFTCPVMNIIVYSPRIDNPFFFFFKIKPSLVSFYSSDQRDVLVDWGGIRGWCTNLVGLNSENPHLFFQWPVVAAGIGAAWTCAAGLHGERSAASLIFILTLK